MTMPVFIPPGAPRSARVAAPDPVAARLARARRAVLLTEGLDLRTATAILATAALRARSQAVDGEADRLRHWQILEARPDRHGDWEAGIAAAQAATPGMAPLSYEFFTPLALAYSHKYSTPCGFVPTKPILVNLDAITRNTASHAWGYFAPVLRAAHPVLAVGPVTDRAFLRPLIELVAATEAEVVTAAPVGVRT